jgi:DNA-binding transcriptional LysR family regulator
MATTGRAYKEITFQQLRSFCETARLGSFTAAAKFLDVAHPTVWKQVHALERELDTKLLEPFGRGCRLTSAGELLAELAQPAVASIGTLKRRFQEQLDVAETRLTVVSSPRIMVEDLPDCVVAFEKRQPHVRLSVWEVNNEEISRVVEAGGADLGLTASPVEHDNPRLDYSPAYPLDLFLVARADHPLARKRSIRPADLLKYPVVNAPDSLLTPSISNSLTELGVFRTQPRRVEARHAAAIRHYAGMGFGIGFMGRLANSAPQPGFHERNLSSHFGSITVRFVWRRSIVQAPSTIEFMATVRTVLGSSGSSGQSKNRRRKKNN